MRVGLLREILSKYDDNAEITFCCDGCNDRYYCSGVCQDLVTETCTDYSEIYFEISENKG